MGDGNAGTHTGGSQAFAFHQGFEDAALRNAGDAMGAGRQFLQQLLLGLSLQRRNNSIGRKEIGDVHQQSQQWPAGSAAGLRPASGRLLESGG